MRMREMKLFVVLLSVLFLCAGCRSKQDDDAGRERTAATVAHRDGSRVPSRPSNATAVNTPQRGRPGQLDTRGALPGSGLNPRLH